MCGRFKRKSDKQKIAKTFEVTAGIEEADFATGDDLRPQSMQPVIYRRPRRAPNRDNALGGSSSPTGCSSMHVPRASRRQISGRTLFSLDEPSRRAMPSLSG